MLDNSITGKESNVKNPKLDDHLDLIRKIVWNFTKRYELDFDDLFQEACLACLEALPKYNPNRGAFSTFIWHTTSNALRDLISKQSNFDNRHLLTDDFTLQEDANFTSPLNIILAEERFMELWAILSPEAQQICHMVIAEKDIYRHTTSNRFRRPVHLPTDKPRKCRNAIEQVLIQNGWAKATVQSAFREIRAALSTT